MSNSTKAGVVGGLLLASLLSAVRPGLAQTSAVRTESQIRTVRDFLEVAYPELFGKGRFLKISMTQPIDNAWDRLDRMEFEIKLFDPQLTFNIGLDQHTGKPIPPPQNATVLQGIIQFDDTGHVVMEDTNTPKQLSEIEALIESHPEWSDAKDYEELKKAGALYGPADKEQFIRSIHVDRFDRFLGHLEIKSVEFDGVSKEHVGSFAPLNWHVRADAELSDGSHRTYTLGFEPFRAQLTGLSRSDRPTL
jgi:hypothetical protein